MASAVPTRLVAAAVVAALFQGCASERPKALGTLERDRITLPAPAAERIVTIHVKEGQRVEQGDPLVQLDSSTATARAKAAQAMVQQKQHALDELNAGARSEEFARARADLAAAKARASDARAYLQRLKKIGNSEIVAEADLDRAQASARTADARVRAVRATINELRSGARKEQVAQAEAALQMAVAESETSRILLNKLDVVAPRTGIVDSLPFKIGDQAPVGAPLVVLLVGKSPYARIYVPEQRRLEVSVGTVVRVFVDGRTAPLSGEVRMIRGEPSFTPYYALTGKDTARLSYVAEVTLGEDAADLPVGLPVTVEIGE